MGSEMCIRDRGGSVDGIAYADREYRVDSGQYLRDMFKFRLFSGR